MSNVDKKIKKPNDTWMITEKEKKTLTDSSCYTVFCIYELYSFSLCGKKEQTMY